MASKFWNEADPIDAVIVAEITRAWNRRTGPRVGDYVKMLDGSLKRFTHDWYDAGIQTTSSIGGDQSFHIGIDGRASYSGGLDPIVSKARLRFTGEAADAPFWFWHHGRAKAHNGVNVMIDANIYQELPA
jgi:hypothetical protein